MGFTFDDFMGDLNPVGQKITNGVNSTPLSGFFYNPAKDKAAAQQGLSNATGAYNGLTPPSFSNVDLKGPAAAADATATSAGPSAMGGISTNPSYKGAQTAQLTALNNLAARGGRSAASDANLAAIQDQENQNARGQRGAAMAGLNSRGMGSSGASLLAQLDANQNGATNQNARDLGVAGQEANTSLAAGQGAAGIGANLEAQDFGEQASKAQAQDAINKFNAGQTTGVSEFNTQKNQGVNNATAQASNQGQVLNNYEMPQTTYQDQLSKSKGVADTSLAGTKYYQDQQKQNSQQQGNLWGGAAQLGTSALGGGGLSSLFGGGAAGATPSATGLAGAGGVASEWGGDAGVAMAGGAAEASPYLEDAAPYAEEGATAVAWKGGKTPGTPIVHGDSPLNDFVPIMSSPGEVHVPPTLAAHGSKDQIGQFVKNAPPIQATPKADRNKEAMLSALKNIAARRRVA